MNSVVKVSSHSKDVRWVRFSKPHLYRKPCGCWNVSLAGQKSPLWEAAKGVARKLNSKVVCKQPAHRVKPVEQVKEISLAH